MTYIKVSPEAEAEMLWLMKENDSQIVPSNLFEIITKKYPVDNEVTE
jgi:hypothetical protein